jgi:hypothetical protein
LNPALGATLGIPIITPFFVLQEGMGNAGVKLLGKYNHESASNLTKIISKRYSTPNISPN